MEPILSLNSNDFPLPYARTCGAGSDFKLELQEKYGTVFGNWNASALIARHENRLVQRTTILPKQLFSDNSSKEGHQFMPQARKDGPFPMTFAIGKEDVAPASVANYDRIARIERMQLLTIPMNKLVLLVTATGQTNTAHWKDVHLSLRIYIMPPTDGIYELDFVGNNQDAHLDMLETLTRTYVFSNVPSDAKGVRVIAAQNSMQQLLSSG